MNFSGEMLKPQIVQHIMTTLIRFCAGFDNFSHSIIGLKSLLDLGGRGRLVSKSPEVDLGLSNIIAAAENKFLLQNLA